MNGIAGSRVLVVGGTGRLGRMVVHELHHQGSPVRVLTRSAAKAAELRARGVDATIGDVRERPTLAPALAGVRTVIATAHGADSSGKNGPRHVEGRGYKNLIGEARMAGIDHLVYVSSANASPASPSPYFRLKAQVEAEIVTSGVPYTIVSPTHLMETWAAVVADPMIRRSRAMVFGNGRNPISFVAGPDVAVCTARFATGDPLRRAVELGGPEQLTIPDLVGLLEEALGRRVKRQNVSIPILRASSILVRPFNEVLSRQMLFAALIATRPQTVDSSLVWKQLGIEPQTFAWWIADHQAELAAGSTSTARELAP